APRRVVDVPYTGGGALAARLPDGDPRHWTGQLHPICGMIRIDGETWRFIGAPLDYIGLDAPAMRQTALTVLPTRTVYEFDAASIALTLTFMTAALPHNLELLSRPVTTVEIDLRSLDGRSHRVALYLDLLGHWAVDNPAQKVIWGRHRLDDHDLLWMGSLDQPLLAKSGDDLRIDWGYVYVSSIQPARGALADNASLRGQFADSGSLPDRDDTEMPRTIDSRPPHPALAWAYDAGNVETASWQIILAYDDGFSVEYMQRRLRPFWRRDGMTAADLISATRRQFPEIRARCRAYDEELMADLRAVGGDKYAKLAALAFRQCLGAHKLVADLDGTPLFFSKENFSNGCMGTVDVSYPSSPFFLLFNPDLLEAMLTPILDYAASPRWKFPFAPHDIGRYPLANGQVYGGGETSEWRQMPVEECGNMLIMATALCKARSDFSYARKHWKTLTAWAEYLLDKGLDPEDQLCTDDFAGHLAHNVNLSVKALIAIAGYAWLCRGLGQPERAAEIREQVERMAADWLRMADDGDHYRLTFDRPGAWSQKYNLVWDRLLDLDLFPPALRAAEIAYYKGKRGRYGLPLDSRDSYTKLDWAVWSASLAESQDDFEAFIAPLFDWLNESESRVPLTDWFYTDSGAQAGMQARSVVGGVYIKMLYNSAIHEKWLRRRENFA
ncbi:MAG: DUF4965 domain-containing protein, partial [Chloroflexi bacterium]|nr:DUF4965 domain-containing protein [Chloroflexota bacterium]